MQDLPGWELHYSNRLSCMHFVHHNVAASIENNVAACSYLQYIYWDSGVYIP